MIILCIDNDPDDIDFFLDAIKEVDPSINCLSALDGQGALDLLASIQDAKEFPAYIFLDINMPRMDGTETLKEIRKNDRYHSIQIVMLSTGLNPKHSVEYKELGANHLMAKANSFKDLRDKLTAILKNSH
jgi:CheY-like chemotaxis protein